MNAQEPGQDHLSEKKARIRHFSYGGLRRCATSYAARLLQNFLHTAKVQQACRETRAAPAPCTRRERSARSRLTDRHQTLADDPVAMLPQVAEIKKRYTAIFGN